MTDVRVKHGDCTVIKTQLLAYHFGPPGKRRSWRTRGCVETIRAWWTASTWESWILWTGRRTSWRTTTAKRWRTATTWAAPRTGCWRTSSVLPCPFPRTPFPPCGRTRPTCSARRTCRRRPRSPRAWRFPPPWASPPLRRLCPTTWPSPGEPIDVQRGVNETNKNSFERSSTTPVRDVRRRPRPAQPGTPKR